MANGHMKCSTDDWRPMTYTVDNSKDRILWVDDETARYVYGVIGFKVKLSSGSEHLAHAGKDNRVTIVK
jgi:hypothetical protein